MSLALVACGSSATTPPAPPRPPTPPPVAGVAVDPGAKLEIISEDARFGDVPGTVVRPTPPGRYAGIVLMAGSGPTDRDWNSPLIAGKNGSGKLLAEALARRGAVVLRFDKAGVGGNHTPIDKITLDTYRDEGRAALALLRARPDVDGAHLFVMGNSEGGIHATRVALAEGHALAGLVLLSSAGRTMKVIIVAQVEAQLRRAMPAQADAIIAAIQHALDDFVAGTPVDPAKVTAIPQLNQLVAAIVNPATAPLVRALVTLDPAPLAAQVDVPVFVFNGLKDIQVDPQLDATRLADARKAAHRDVTLFLAPDANHVLEHEPRSLEVLRANLLAVDYNTDARTLDDTTLAALAGWLARLTTSRP